MNEVIESPPITLDFVASKDFIVFGGTYGIGARIQNILGDEFEATRTDLNGEERAFQTFDRGRIFSLSVSREF